MMASIRRLIGRTRKREDMESRRCFISSSRRPWPLPADSGETRPSERHSCVCVSRRCPIFPREIWEKPATRCFLGVARSGTHGLFLDATGRTWDQPLKWTGKWNVRGGEVVFQGMDGVLLRQHLSDEDLSSWGALRYWGYFWMYERRLYAKLKKRKNFLLQKGGFCGRALSSFLLYVMRYEHSGYLSWWTRRPWWSLFALSLTLSKEGPGGDASQREQTTREPGWEVLWQHAFEQDFVFADLIQELCYGRLLSLLHQFPRITDLSLLQRIGSDIVNNQFLIYSCGKSLLIRFKTKIIFSDRAKIRPINTNAWTNKVITRMDETQSCLDPCLPH